MPSHATERNDPHGASQLDTLLWELLDTESAETPGVDIGAPRGIAELREMARRLWAASQRAPLPEGRLAVRRALLVTAEESQNRAGLGRASWRRAGLWLSMAALVAVVGAFSLGAGALDVLVPPSSPAYGFRLVLDNARGTFGLGHPGVGQYALSYQFSPVQMPSAASETRTAVGKVGGLPATMTLTGAEACATGGACGRFVMSLASVSTLASAQFGEMTGTFACASGRCTLTLDKATGVFAKVTGPLPSVSGSGVSEGQLGTKFASLGEWVAMVASAAETLDASGMLPAGLTVGDLVNDAATNEKAIRHNTAPNGGGKKDAPSLVNPGGKQSSQTSNANDQASESRGTNRVGTRSGSRVDGGATVHNNVNNVDIGRRASSQTNNGGSTPHHSTGGSPTSPGVTGSGPIIRNHVDGDVSNSHQSAGPNGHGGTNVDDGTDVSGGLSSGAGVVDASVGGNVNGGASLGSVGVNLGAGTSLSGGASLGSVGVNAGAGASFSSGASLGSGGVNLGAGTGLSGGASLGSGGVNAGAGASVSGGASLGSGGVNAGAGASVSGGASLGSGGVHAGAGASVSGGASVGGASGGKPGGTSGSGGISVGGGVSVNVGGVGIGIGVGGINISGGGSGSGSGSGNGGKDAGSGSH